MECRARRLPTLAAAVLLSAVGCTGRIGALPPDPTASQPDRSGGASGHGGAAGSVGAAGATPNGALAEARVRRLTESEVRNALADIWGVASLGDARFPVESEQGQFDNRYDRLVVSSDFADALQAAAEATGAYVASHMSAVWPCAVATSDEAACLGQFLDRQGRRTYRRPLTADERRGITDLFIKTRATEDLPTTVATVVEAMVQSPAFLFRSELGQAQAARTRLRDDEIAGALSFFLTRTTPDDALLDAAAAGRLARDGEVETQARRLLETPRAKDGLHDFFLQWLGIGASDGLSKSDARFTPQLAASMTAETVAFVDDAWTAPDGYARLFTSHTGFIDQALADLYGVSGFRSGVAALTRTELDSQQRAGLLTQASFIATHTPGANRSPVGLGHFIRTKLFCQDLPPPPPGAPPLALDANLDVVARFARHRGDPSCRGCHSHMDPIGLGFAAYDVLGRYAPDDHGVTEDGAGELIDTDVDGVFHGPVELGRKLLESPSVRSCFAATALAFALGRPTTGAAQQPADDASAQALAALLASSGDLKELFVAVVTSPAFLYRDASQRATP